jgi:hypothetical protein
MNASLPQRSEPLQAQVDETLDKLGGLERNLHAIGGELDELGVQRRQHELLEQTCSALEKLAELDAQELFWGEGHEAGRAASHLERARQRLASFHSRIAEIESRRQAVVDQIAAGREVLAILEDDLDEQRREEEELRNEWVVERELAPEPMRIVAMPWVRGREDDRRLRKFLLQTMAAAALLGAVLPLIDLPLPEPTEVIEVPARLVELIRERRPLPPPQTIEERPPEPTPEQQQATEPPPEQEPQQLAAEQAPEAAPVAQPAGESVPNEPPGQRARQSGILAFRETFAAAANRPAAALGTSARISNGGDEATGRPERAMVASSGGINVGAISRGLAGSGDGSGGGGALTAGVTATREGGVIGGSGGGGGAGRPLAGGSGVAGRTDEEIQIVFDRYKAALYRLYNRELRANPTLRGQMVLKLTIEPNGSVSFLELQSTDMNAPNLAAQVLERVRTFDFGAKDVAAITIVYPIDFLPAA